MPYQKKQLKYSAVSAVIGSLLWLLLDQFYIAFHFMGYSMPMPPHFSISFGVFMSVFLVLGIIAKIEKPSFSLILPVFLIYLAILLPIIFIANVVPALTIPFHPFFTPFELFLEWLKYGVPHVAVFSLIGITAGIMMVRFTSKLKYDAFYFIFSSLIGAGVGTFLVKLSWEIKYTTPYSPLFPYLSLFTLIGPLIGIIIIQIAWLRKRQPSNCHTCISIAFWIIAFITAVFIYEWVTYVQQPWHIRILF